MRKPDKARGFPSAEYNNDEPSLYCFVHAIIVYSTVFKQDTLLYCRYVMTRYQFHIGKTLLLLLLLLLPLLLLLKQSALLTSSV